MEHDFTVTEAAKARIRHILVGEPNGASLRISVEGGGCSGFQYHFDLDAGSLTDGDIRFGDEAAPVIIDETSLGLLNGSMLDFVETLGSAAFEIKNPNAKASCGCGNSFTVAL